MSSILSTWSKSDAEKLLKSSGFTVLGKQVKESIVLNIAGKEHLSLLAAPYTVEKGGKKFVVIVPPEGTELTAPELRKTLVEYERAFGFPNLLLIDPGKNTLTEIVVKYPREKGLDFYFQFFIALFIIGIVIGIIWLLIMLKMY